MDGNLRGWGERTVFAGFGWAHDHPDVVIVDREALVVDDFRVEDTAGRWHRERSRDDPANCRRLGQRGLSPAFAPGLLRLPPARPGRGEMPGLELVPGPGPLPGPAPDGD